MTIQDALVEVLVDTLTEKKGIARRPWIVNTIRSRYPQFDSPRLDLIVGVNLNELIAADILSRTTIQGKTYYHISEGYIKRLQATSQK